MMARPKYIWRPDYDDYLKEHYFGGLKRRFKVLNHMVQLTGLPRWHIKRQAARLGLTRHADRRPWSAGEVSQLAQLVGTVHWQRLQSDCVVRKVLSSTSSGAFAPHDVFNRGTRCVSSWRASAKVTPRSENGSRRAGC